MLAYTFSKVTLNFSYFHYLFIIFIKIVVSFPLRYYATFKVRKFESLFYKINTFLQKITTCTGLQAGRIICKYITYFSILGVAFAVSFLCYF